MPEDIKYDVIISGAGPVGLFLACELALANCSVLILEKAEDPASPLKRFPFGIRGLSSPSIEAFYRRDLLYGLEISKRFKTPHKIHESQSRKPVGHFAGISLMEDNVNTSQWKFRLPGSQPTGLMSEMQEIETMLEQRATALGVVIKRGCAVTGFEQTADNVTVQSGDQSFSAKWLVGCDGSRSIIRKSGGFDFAGTEPEFTGYSSKVEFADPQKLSPGRVITSSGMYFQSQPGYLLMQDFDGGAFHSTGQDITLEHLQSVLRRISDTDVAITEMHMATTWTDRSRQATSYRNRRVLLAGDAAHIHSPLGGQGLNLGLGDAMNLGWKLAATIHNKAPEDLLDSYFSERFPIGERVLDWSRAQVAIMRPGAASRALNAIIRDLIETEDGATYFAGRIWGILTRYDLGSNHPLVGMSVPDFEFEEGKRLGELMRGGTAVLLDFEGNDLLKTLAGEYDQIEYISGMVKDNLEVSAVLIRPDGIVAWVAEGDVELRTAIDKWFVPNV